MDPADAYQPDRSLKGKLRRRLVRFQSRRPAPDSTARGAVSFTFDDPPVTATTTGARILEERGMRGAYFVADGLLGGTGPMGAYADWDDIARLAAVGHEIACHTATHLDCGKASGAGIAADAEQNRAALIAHGLPSPQTFAYPYGEVTRPAKAALGGQYGLLRALHHGLIEPGSDLNQAPAVGIEGEDGEATALSWMRRAAARNAWLILYTHDVAEHPSPWGCTPGALERLADAAKDLKLDVVTVAAGVGQA